jgi:hypothetical protein
MNFRGVVDNFNKIADPKAGDVIAFSADCKDGETVIAKTGSEWVYDGEKWVEIGTASATDAALDALAGRVDTIESDLNTETTGIKARLTAAEGDIDALQAIVSTNTNSHEVRIGAIETAIATGGSVANAIADAKQAGIDAQADVDALEKVVYAGSASSGTTSAPADGTVMKDIDDLQTLTTGGTVATGVTKMVSGGVVYTAIEAAKSGLIGGDADTTYAKTIKGAKDYAKDYADTVAANAVKNNIKAGNNDIVINRPTEGDDVGKTVISHKDYGSGTLTKDPTALEDGDAYVFTGLELLNGHVTGGAMKSLADILSAMEFILDGGNAGDVQ